MRKIAIAATALAAVVAVPAQAHHSSGDKPDHPSKSHKCKPHSVAYKAKGTLESQSLSQTQGSGTTTRKDDRYSGDVTVNVKKANHHGATGSQTFSVTDVKVRFYDANHDGTADTPKAGDRVRLWGRITRLAKKCDQTGFTPTVTIRRIQFKPAAKQ